MAHSNESIITGKLRGSLGKELVFRKWKEKTIVAKSPKKRDGDPTPKQTETQEKFLLASRYAKSILKSQDQDIRDIYAAAVRPRQNIYSRALEDFLTTPVVKSIKTDDYNGSVDSTIRVRALDDLQITEVRVEIYAANGSLLEAGKAVEANFGLDWIYTAALPNNQLVGTRIRAIATDIPRNNGTLEVTL